MMLEHFRRHEALVIVNREDEFAKLARTAGIKVQHLALEDVVSGFRSASILERWRRLAAWTRHNVELWRLLRRLRPAVVHLNDLPEAAVAAPALMALRLPVVTHVRNEMRMRPRHQLALALSGAHVTISNGVAAANLSRVSPVLRKRIARRGHVIYNGIDLSAVAAHEAAADRAAIRGRLGLAPDHVVALVTASLEERKGQLPLVEHVLPRALADAPSLRVLMAGGTKPRDGRPATDVYRRAVEAKIQASGIGDRVFMLGYRADIFDLLVAADLVVLTSLREGLGRAIIEASAFGRPSVAFAVPGVTETIDDGQTGRLIAPGDHSAFSQALVELAANPSQRRRFGDAARLLAAERFDVATNAASMEALIESVFDPYRVTPSG